MSGRYIVVDPYPGRGDVHEHFVAFVHDESSGAEVVARCEHGAQAEGIVSTLNQHMAIAEALAPPPRRSTADEEAPF